MERLELIFGITISVIAGFFFVLMIFNALLMDKIKVLEKFDKKIQKPSKFFFLAFILFLSWGIFKMGFYSGSLFVFFLSLLIILVITADIHEDILKHIKKIFKKEK